MREKTRAFEVLEEDSEEKNAAGIFDPSRDSWSSAGNGSTDRLYPDLPQQHMHMRPRDNFGPVARLTTPSQRLPALLRSLHNYALSASEPLPRIEPHHTRRDSLTASSRRDSLVSIALTAPGFTGASQPKKFPSLRSDPSRPPSPIGLTRRRSQLQAGARLKLRRFL